MSNATLDGNLLVITAPSGAGKSSFIQLFMERNPNFVFAVSHTSRPPRKEESHGKEYYFVDRGFFEEKIATDFFVEWAVVHENYYGTSWDELKRLQAMGKKIILDIDVQGSGLLRKQLRAFYVALAVRDLNILKERLMSRHTETPEKMKVRLENAEKEIRLLLNWPHRIMNDDLLRAVETLEALLESEGFLGSKDTGGQTNGRAI